MTRTEAYESVFGLAKAVEELGFMGLRAKLLAIAQAMDESDVEFRRVCRELADEMAPGRICARTACGLAATHAWADASRRVRFYCDYHAPKRGAVRVYLYPTSLGDRLRALGNGALRR
jgi:hypothetical protein